VDNKGDLWIDDLQVRRIPVDQIEENTAAFMRLHEPQATAIETNNFQELVAHHVHKRVPQFAIYPYNSTENKQVRIRMLVTPPLSQGKIHIRNCPAGRIMVQQMKDFPIGSHDDAPDSLALMLRLRQDLLGGATHGLTDAGNLPITTS